MKKTRAVTNLIGSPTFVDLGNGRLRCVETGHEVLVGDKESYSLNKRCRLELIDHALSLEKPPLNMFSQSPLSRTKLVCKLTGDTVNKKEEHILKHLNGKRFLHKLEQVKKGTTGSSGKTRVNKPRGGGDNKDVDSEESDFWMISSSSSGSESEIECDQQGNIKGNLFGYRNFVFDLHMVFVTASHCNAKESQELAERTKRMTIEIGPSSFASRKKKLRND
ncbi:unnamed protein product [Cochlearia groenlandica]